MKKTYINKITAILSASAITLGVFSCSDPDYPTPVPATAAPTSSANIRFINASPDAPALSFSVNNIPAAAGIAFQQISDYSKTPAGQASVRGVGASGDIGGTLGKNPILYRATATTQNNFTFVNGAYYTFVVTDSIARPKPSTLNGTNPGGPQFIALSDNLTAPAPGKAKIRIVNAAAGESNVWATTSSGVELPVNGTKDDKTGLTPGIAKSAGSSLVSINAGDYTIELRSKSNTGDVRISDTFTFESGKIYTIVFTGKMVAGTTDPIKVPYEYVTFVY